MIIVLGTLIVVLCTIVQGLVIVSLRHMVIAWNHYAAKSPGFLGETAFLSCIVAALFLGMCVQVIIWATVFLQAGQIDSFETAAYFSMVNFTTLGYGDIILSSEYRLLGPMEASNGILMLGLSTSFLFAVLQDRLQSGEQT